MAKRLGGVVVLYEALLGSASGGTQGDHRSRKLNLKSLDQEQKLHLQEMDKLDREIPLPSDKTRGFVFRH